MCPAVARSNNRGFTARREGYKVPDPGSRVMRIYELGARVYGNGGELWGRLAQLIVQPETHAVSHAVVYSADDGHARLVPIALTRPTPDGIALSCSSHAVESMSSPVAVRLVASRRRIGPAARTRIEADEHLPEGTVPLREKEPVKAVDGDAGRIRGLVIAEDSHEATHFVVEEKRLWNRKRVAVPLQALAKMTHHSVRLQWSRAAIKDLPRL